jgi:hypothetical protein
MVYINKNSRLVIAIITPNSDTFTNPTMTSLFHILKEKGVEVFLFGPIQHPACPDNLQNVNAIQSVFKLNLFKNPTHYIAHWSSYLKIIKTLRKEKISTLLAVDPMGIIVGGRIKKLFRGKIHLSYLSFEIFFKKELSDHYLSLKEKEIYYSAGIDSLLIQDEKRRELLLKEKSISLPFERIALVPVSPLKIEVLDKSDIHSMLLIPKQKKLVIYSGSVGTWCGTNAIIEAFDKGYWNNDYWLVFHTRKTIDSNNPFFADLIRLDADEKNPFSLHPNPYDSFEELAQFLSGFDIALALYYPNNENPYYGMNMKEIGLSSGKFSTYMMLGLPTIVTSCSIYEELLHKYKFGAILYDLNFLNDSFKKVENNENNALKLYDEILEPESKLIDYVNILRLCSNG